MRRRRRASCCGFFSSASKSRTEAEVSRRNLLSFCFRFAHSYRSRCVEMENVHSFVRLSVCKLSSMLFLLFRRAVSDSKVEGTKVREEHSRSGRALKRPQEKAQLLWFPQGNNTLRMRDASLFNAGGRASSTKDRLFP